MAENNQLSDETKNNSTDTSSTDASSAVIGNHENAVVPHKISNHDKLVQTMVMVDGEWINVNDTNDQANMKEDVHKVNKKVVEAQKGIVEAKNAADSAVKYADSAISASKVNSDAIAAQNGAITDAQRTANSALEDAKNAMKNVSSEAASIRNDVKQAQDSISSTKTDLKKEFSDATADLQVQVNKNSAAILKNSGAIEIQERTASDAIADLKVADGQIKTIASDAQSNAATAVQTASAATVMVSDAASDIAQIKLTASEAAFNATDAKSQAAQARATADSFSTRISSVESDTDKRLTANTSSIEQMKDTIALKADQSTVDDVKKDVSNVSAELRIQAGQISSKAESKDIDELTKKVNDNSTAIDQNAKMISAKANQTDVDTLNGSVTNNTSRLDLLGQEIKMKVDSSTVNNLIDSKGFITQKMTQTLIDQKADTINESITGLSRTVNGNNTTVMDKIQSITASIDGVQSTVANKADKSQITQLSNAIQSKVSASDFDNLRKAVDLQTLDSADINNMKTNGHYFVHNLANNPIGGWVYVDVTGNANDRIRQDVYQDIGTKHAFRRWFGSYWTEWSTGAEESEITQLRSDINLRVKSGDLLSQINIAAGRTLIQSNKIYFDADSFVMSPNSTAFIPSAYITNINADKITTGTLDAAKFNVKNFSADNIVGGTLNGVVVKTGANDRYFQTSKDNIYWVRNGSMSLVGNDTYLNRANGLNIADVNNIQLTTWGGASVNPDGSIVNTSGNAGHPKIVVDTNGNWDPDDPYGTKWGGGPGDSEITQWVGNKEYTVLTRNQGFTVHLNDGNNNSIFAIQKDNKVGFYVGQGENGNQVNLYGNFNVYGAKNSAVKTSQGDVAVSAYETAEYYFGDIGEGQTDSNGVAYVGIEKLFNETVNTSIPYQVFITAYGPGNVWVEQRKQDRFMVKSSQPNIKFGWEIKAKRRGYENTRLQKVN